MTRDELIALASPPCHQCGEPVIRVETTMTLSQGDGDWIPGQTYLICRLAHRVLIEPL